MQNSLTRREIIKGTVALAALALARHPLTALGLDTSASDEVLIPFLDPQPPGKMLRWEQLKTWITANDDLFAVSHYGTPEVELSKWNLEISGLVRHPKVLSLPEIKSRKRKDVMAALECSGNSSNPGFMGAIGNIKWTGTPLAPLLKECGLLDRAIEIVFFGADEKVEKIRDKDYQQNFACSLARVVRRKDGTLRVSGAAWTDGTPLEKVELQIDNSLWAKVELDKRRHARYAWTFWSYDWKQAQPGEHKLVSRATDAEGRVQPSLDDPAIKLKRTYWEANQQWPRKIRI